MNINKKAANDWAAIANYDAKNYTKIYPPYGKILEQIRQAGLIPEKRIIVSTRWDIGGAYPRIVVTNEIPISNLRFSYLAGLSVQIVYFNEDNHFINDLIDAIKSVRPKNLYLFNMDNVKVGLPAFQITEPRHVEGAEHD